MHETDPLADLISAADLLQTAEPPKTALVGMTEPELVEFLGTLGQPAFRGRQLFGWLYGKGVAEIGAMTNLPAALRAKLAEVAAVGQPVEKVRQHDRRTGTRKFLFELGDGQQVEAVLMPHRYGLSACISTQVGCRLGCRFCASTLNGLARNLTAGEMVGQLLAMNRLLAVRKAPASPAAVSPAADSPDAGSSDAGSPDAGSSDAGSSDAGSSDAGSPDQAPRSAAPAPKPAPRISSVVLMGSGEPMENYEQVLKAIRLMHEPNGLNIGYRHITLSSSGLVPEIRRLAAEGLPITLALSLHAPNQALRSELMPVNKMFPLAEVVAACKEYAETTGRRVTYEYLLLAGVNDQDQHADQLAALLRGSLAHVNLIPYNPVAERPYRRPSRERVLAFAERLEALGMSVTTRRTMGVEIDAACGQLRNRNLKRPAAGARPLPVRRVGGSPDRARS